MTGDRTITINVKAAVDQLVSGMKQGETAVKNFATQTESAVAKVEASTERISHLFRAAFEAFIGFEAINTLKKIAEAADEAANTLDVAARVAKNFNNSLDPAAIEKWLEAFANSAQGGGYAIDEMRKSLGEFAALGLNASQIQRALADTAELAASRNLDYAQAANIVRFALTGHVEMLSRYGIVSREAAKGITTVEQAMEAIEKASSGAAEERSEKLIGSLGRLGSAASKLRDDFGSGLVPIFNAVAIVLTGFANALDAIPKPILQVVASAAALGVGLIALTLVLPAIAKGIEIVKEGFALLGVVGAPLISFFKDLYIASAGGAAGLIDFAGGELAAIAPVAALVLAIAGIIVALREVIQHLDHVQKAWKDFCQYLGDAFHEFVDRFTKDKDVLVQTIESVVAYLANPTQGGLVETQVIAAPKAYIKGTPNLDKDLGDIGHDIVSDWSKTWKQIQGLFSIGGGKGPGVPKTPFDGIVPGSGNTGAQHAINEALAAAKGVIDAAAAVAAQSVDRARARLDATKAELETFDATHEGDKLTPELAAQREQLIANQLREQMALRDALIHQQAAELNASTRYAALAKALPASDKDRLSHAAELNKAADEHRTKAIQIKAAWEQVASEIARAMKALIGVPIDLAAQQYADAVRAIEAAHAQTQAHLHSESDTVAFQQRVGSATGAAPEALADLAIKAAELAEAMADDTVATVEQQMMEANGIANQADRESTMAKLFDQLAAAGQAQLKAQQDLTLAVIEANKAHTQWLQSLVSQIPGASVKYDDKTGKFAGFAFGFQTILGQAIEKTKSFADVMQVVNVIMNLFAQVIDAFRPVIDALLEVVLGVAQVFVLLWNAIASVLRLLGIHIQNLKLENQLESSSPLIRIFHDLPTLQEANSTGPLSLTAIEDAYQNNVTNPINEMLQSPNLGGGLLGVLGEILGALLIIKALMAAFGGGSSGGGLFGWISKLFGGGGSDLINPAGFDAAQGVEYGMPGVSVPEMTDAVQQGVTSALSDSTLTGSDGYVSQAVSSGVQDAAQTAGSSASSATSSIFTGAGIMSALGGAFEGIEFGKIFSKMFGTDSPAWGEALGAAGGVAGGLMGAALFASLGLKLGALAGPLGALGGALLGAIIGGMIGPHWGPPSNYPDRSDPNYGTMFDYRTFIADYTGAPGSFDGHTVGPGAAFSNAAGGENITSLLESFVKNANPKALTGAALQIFDELKKLGGASGNLGIKSEYNGVFTLNSGQQVSVQNLMELVNAFFKDGLQGAGQTLAGMAQNVRNASDALNELTSAVTLQGNAISRSQLQSAGKATSGGSQGAGDVHFHVTTGDIHGYNDLEDLMEDLALATARAMPNRRYVSGAGQP